MNILEVLEFLFQFFKVSYKYGQSKRAFFLTTIPHQKWSFSSSYLHFCSQHFSLKMLHSLKFVIDLLWSLLPVHPNILLSLLWLWKQTFIFRRNNNLKFLWVNIPKLCKWFVGETFVPYLEIDECFHFLVEIIPFWSLGWNNVRYMVMCAVWFLSL